MKQIIAIVKPYLADKLIQALADLPVEEISIREVKGYGRQKDYLEGYGENEYSLAFVPKVEVSVWVDEEADENRSQTVTDRIIAVCRTGRLGDGKIMILPVVG